LTLAVACRRGDNDELQRYFKRLLKAKLVPQSLASFASGSTQMYEGLRDEVETSEWST
jgi:hypothetical protein